MRYLLLFMMLVGIFMFGKRCSPLSFMGTKGSGPIKTEIRTVSDFHGIDLNASGDVEIRVSEQYSVEVQVQENLLPLLKTEVENGRLKIYFSENVRNLEGLKILVSGPAFDELSVEGSGTISVQTPLNSERLNVGISGSGNVQLPQATLGALECSISGSGGMEVGGSANAVQANISGSGELDAKKMTINELRSSVSGSGSVSAHVVQVLKADISGSGDVYYTGEPTVEASVSGSGSVQKQ